MKKLLIFSVFLVLNVSCIFGQDATEKTRPRIYVGYDFGEMAFNKFQNFAGEAGLRFKNDHTFRLIYLNVKLTEEHLSTDFANAIDGDNVSGLWKGYDLVYDIPVFKFKDGMTLLYAGVLAGYHDTRYQHTTLDEFVEHKTVSAGIDIGFRDTDVFNIKGLYMNLQIPIRYNFTTLEETILGESTVNKSSINQTISFFVGYEF